MALRDNALLVDHWPLVGLRLTTPRLEIRLEEQPWPTDASGAIGRQG
jgi:hypothetical protein